MDSGEGRKRRQPVKNPLDWNTPLLEELSYFSAGTKNKVEIAYQALLDAVSRRQSVDGGQDGTQVLKEDVQAAARICKANKPEASRAPVPIVASEVPTEDIASEVLLNEATEGLDIPPPTPRSTTAAGENPVIKVEPGISGLQSMSTGAETANNHAFMDYNDEVDKAEEWRLEAEENEAKAAAIRAQREQIKQRRRIRDLMHQHGLSREDAISLEA